MYLTNPIEPLSRTDIQVLEIIEDGSEAHGHFMTLIVQSMMYADGDNLTAMASIPIFREWIKSFERWKRGESGMLRNRKGSHLTLVH